MPIFTNNIGRSSLIITFANHIFIHRLEQNIESSYLIEKKCKCEYSYDSEYLGRPINMNLAEYCFQIRATHGCPFYTFRKCFASAQSGVSTIANNDFVLLEYSFARYPKLSMYYRVKKSNFFCIF